MSAAPPAPPAAPAALDLDNADPLGLSLDEDFRSRRPEPRKITGPLVTFDLDDVVGDEPPRPVVIPTRAEPEAAADPAAVPFPDEPLGFDAATGDSGSISAPADPADPRDNRYVDFLLPEDPGTGPPPIDSHPRLSTGPVAAIAPGSLVPSADDDDIDRVLARVFAPGVSSQGGIPGIDADPSWSARHLPASSATRTASSQDPRPTSRHLPARCPKGFAAWTPGPRTSCRAWRNSRTACRTAARRRPN